MKWDNQIREEADLKVDYDSHRNKPIKKFNRRAKYLLKYFPSLSPLKINVYKTKKGYHFYVYASSGFLRLRSPRNHLIYYFFETRKVLFQSILGSDWLRELRNFDRINKDDKNWNILFSEKDKNGKIQKEKFYCSYVLKAKGDKNAKSI